MTVASHISDLLYRYECVILPGFGAFLTHRQSANYDEKTQAFYPPKKLISFNGQLKKNDGLLANYIADAEQLSYPAAVYSIQEYVEKLQIQLQKESHVELENLGIFSLNSEDVLQFEPVKETNFLTEAFGLSHVPATAVKREVYKKQAEQLEEKAPIHFTPERRESRPYLKYAAIAVLALGLSGLTGLNIYSNQVTEHNVAEQQAAESQLQQKIQQATFIIDNPLPEITLKVTKQSGDFHVVAGAYRVEENAHLKVTELRAEGHKARYIGENRYGLHQVVYSSHETRREAINMLYQVKKSNDGAWLLVQEL
ncbi:SPOR domain-containing protein [Antarcticibacterium sp. 1MA-6-2]|uniref:HU domain-containing protein n=1 Tax=Antarcticibacterium sp. 1MA-6-2 TaxID=2908210 RepID=UPI001F2AB6A6|nr:SPOR domain-containing protein [Antarcticibacterium sp. 1MA-6-2]UJH90243.1 SPOR domain-containing protein [Antarcticibacterium sp. 1MA-6-2]